MFGKALRQIKSSKAVYLSFDDGPDPILTPLVLDLLKKHEAKATFFVIGNKVKENASVIKRIQDEKHAIGNHSLDHSYTVFFKGYSKLRKWVLDSEALLKEHNITSVGFRPPVGIRTPELAKALKDLKLPLILWKLRCYDSIFHFTEEKAQKMAESAQAGDIILLHDVQKHERHLEFLKSLEKLILSLKKQNLELSSLSSS